MSALNGWGSFATVPSVVSSSSSRRQGLIVGPSRRYSLIQDGINAAGVGDVVFVDPGEYAEELTIPFSKSNIALVGLGGRGSVAIQADTDGVALTNNARDITIQNIGLEGDGAGGGLVNTGRRFRAYASKIEGGTNALIASLGTVAQIAAHTHDKGDDILFEDCEFAYSDNGVLLRASDYGAVTQAFFKKCYFHSLPDSSFEESNGTGGAAGVHYRGLLIDECTFGAGDEETHTLPTKWISLDDDNANDGVVCRCVFPTLINSGLNLVSTALLWTGNFMAGGVSAAQPS